MEHKIYKDSERLTLAAAGVEDDLKKDTQTLLRELHEISLRTIGPDERSASLANAKFATLLCRLGENSERQTKSIMRLTWGLLFLTLVLAILTALLSYDTHALAKRDAKSNQPEQKR